MEAATRESQKCADCRNMMKGEIKKAMKNENRRPGERMGERELISTFFCLFQSPFSITIQRQINLNKQHA